MTRACLGVRLGATVAVVMSLVGCGTQTIVKTVTAGESSGTATAGSETTNASSSSAAQSQQANIGDTLTITGRGGESLAVTVERVLDPLPVGQFDQADTGNRFVGVQISLKNVGSVAYSDSPGNEATLLSNANEQAKRDIVKGGPCGNDFQSSVNIGPGDAEQGCIPFQLPVGQTASRFQFTLDSGFADQTGQWSLVGPSAVSPSSGSSPGSSNASPPNSPDSGATTDPLGTVATYWQSIQSHQFASAYSFLAPGVVSQTESQFVAQEQQAGIQSARFTGHITLNDGSTAIVDIDSLTTKDTQFGCRDWTGSYQLADQSGQWLITQAKLTPSPCG